MKEKKSKLIPAKKLPGLLKKKYTQKALEQKLLKKIEIPSDRELIQGLFQPYEKKPGLFAADLTLNIEKPQLKRLKRIAKDIKKRRFGFKLVPFTATLIFISALFAGIILLKDILVKKAIVNTMQSIFDAKTDIESVHLEILNSKLQIRNLQQASSEDEMKNIFQISEMTIDFNLTEALRGKIDIEDVTMGEFLVNTDRKKSGKLIKAAKAKKQQEKKEKKAKSKNSASSTPTKQNDLMNKTQKTLNSMFSDYNPQNIYESMQSKLKSPAAALKAQKITEDLISKWEKEPENIQNYVNEVQDLVQNINSFDWQKMNEPSKIKEMIELVNSGIQTGNSIAEKTQNLVKEIEVDGKTVQNYAREINDAIASDRKILESEISKFTSLKDNGIKNIFNDMITAFAYGMAEQYSPHGRKIVDKALELKAKHDASAAKKKSDVKKSKKRKMKKRIAERAPGRFVYYKADRVPKFLLENAYGSGDDWSFRAQEFSSDADKRGKESLLDAELSISGIENKLSAVIDLRSATSNPLVNAEYNGRNIPVNVLIESYGMKSNSAIDCSVIASNSKEEISGKGIMNLSELQIITPAFEPAIIYEIYKDTINSFNHMQIKFGYRWNKEEGLDLSLNTDAGDIFQKAFISSFNKAASRIAAEAKEQISKLLSEKTGIAQDKIKEFLDIENLIKNYDKTVQDMKKQLTEKKKELENLVNGTADKLKKQAEEEAAKAKAMAEAEAARLKAEAEAQAAQARAQAEAEAERLRAEAEALAREEAERARKEAEEAAKKEAEKQAKNLLKGFGF
jgi:uncharacterized protein (TIGR03545 family)